MQDKVALVTGAGSGIGEASARMLAARGARVTLVGRTADELEEVAQGVREAGGEALVAVADVSDEEAVAEAVRATLAEFGRLDTIVANAGVNGTWAGIDDLSVEDFRSTLDINLTGTFITIKAGVPHMNRGGSVVVIASVNGSRIFSNTGATAYSASKAGQIAITKMLAVELGPRGIRVNVICPGAIDTEISDNTNAQNEDVKIPVEFPQGNIPLTGSEPGSSEQVAELVTFLSSDAASHISGTEVWIDGAQSLLQG
ncbi:SDR family oxidoreductase [Pseudactinotalea suaedae]|uniref:SDR family oxidoreductase n=1 Tax=Pseudactinotalea suaedae TaxID=1524924 RepID=UPI0012E2AB67|nr:SDR family NAD(P)-dependent oxidoreductase [Pseudactinotalea suaedae]